MDSSHEVCWIEYVAKSMGDDRGWMYAGWKKGGRHTNEWFEKTQQFVDHAYKKSTHGVIKCPCSKCKNMVAYDKKQVTLHLSRNGFMPGYEVWNLHSESSSRVSTQMEVDDGEEVDRLDHMVEDLQAEFDLDREDPPTKEVQELFELLQALE